MASKYVDTTAIIQVIGTVFNDVSILDLEDRYNIVEEDFGDKFHKIVFGVIYKLYKQGVKNITVANVSDYLSSRPKNRAIFEQNKGEEWLMRASDASQPASFDYYYNRLKKFSLLRAFDNCGIDVTDIYDPDNLVDTKKKQQQEDYLDNATLEQIANQVNNKIDEIRMQFVDANESEEPQQAGEGILNLIDKFKENPEVGIPLYGPLINTVTRGARLRKFYLRSAATGVGKAIPNDTIIPTPKGNRMVGEIRVGDYLYDEHLEPTKVLKVWPQREKKNIWTVVFKDGRRAPCCKDHLWQYRYQGEDKVGTTSYLRYLLEQNPKEKIKVPNVRPKKRHRFKQALFDIIFNGDNDLIYLKSKRVRNFAQKLGWQLGYNVEEVAEHFLIREKAKYNEIERIEISLKKADMTCFTVDNPTSLFLTNDYCVTHNTRTMIADACNFACDTIYDDTFGWIKNGCQEPTLFITTEQDIEEVQTMMLAFLSNVNEEHILNGEYAADEEQRVRKAADILLKSPLFIEELPDFSLKDVEDTIKRAIRDYGIKYVCHDYIHTSLKVLEEITRRSGGVKLREDNILFMLSTKLKDICNKQGVFILSATQLSGKKK